MIRSNDIRLLVCGAALAVLAFSRAWPQQMQPSGDISMHTVHQPYNIETFGEFRKMMMTGDFTAKVQLGSAMLKHPTVGVGAIADARGEISIFDGRLVVSYGKGGKSSDASLEYASLLVLGSVSDWQSVQVDEDVATEDIETYIAAAAQAHGIDANKSFPFEVRGNIGPYAMHVNAAPTGGPHGMGLPMAVTVEHEGDRIDGLVTVSTFRLTLWVLQLTAESAHTRALGIIRCEIDCSPEPLGGQGRRVPSAAKTVVPHASSFPCNSPAPHQPDYRERTHERFSEHPSHDLHPCREAGDFD